MRRTGFVSPDPSDRRVVRTEWSDEAMTDAEVSDPCGSVIEILITNPNSETGSDLPAAATGSYPSEALTVLVEAGNGQSKTKAKKTLAASAAACARKKRPINCTTKKTGVTPASGTSENPGAAYTAAQYMEAEEQQTE